ncbi:MAG TPA: alpha-amylase, partial [Leeuwenhoekiella sp.]|nr:alpha-amylase [Leeuwenhoekiella sp.]
EMYQLPVSYIANSYESLTEAVPQKGILAEVHFKESSGILVDSVYVEPFRAQLFYSLQAGATLKFGKEKLAFERGNITPDSDIEEVSSRIIESKQSNTSIIYDHRYFLKLYRRLDSTVNPDAELSQYLTETVKFANTPDYMGKLVYYTQKRNEAVLGMMQDLVTNVGTGWVNAKDAAHRYMERIETQAQELEPDYDKGLRTRPLLFEDLKEPESDLVESLFPERISLLGRRSAQMHQALASHEELKGFEHEAFSLHYQRSLYSSLQSVTREAFENLRRSIPSLPVTIQAEAEAVLKRKNEVLDCFKRVFKHKINTVKIRTHGDFQLGQLLWTGKDFVIINFEGEPSRPFSERRILRSGLRDVAAMIRSFHYAAYSPLMQQNYAEDYRETHLEAWAEAWYYYVSRFYLDGYISTLKGSDLIPDTERDYQVLLETFLLEKAVGELNTELNHRPLFALVALRGIQAVLDGAHKD